MIRQGQDILRVSHATEAFHHEIQYERLLQKHSVSDLQELLASIVLSLTRSSPNNILGVGIKLDDRWETRA